MSDLRRMNAYNRTVACLCEGGLLERVSHLIDGPCDSAAMSAIVGSVAEVMRDLVDIGPGEYAAIERAVTFSGATGRVSIDVEALSKIVPLTGSDPMSLKVEV